MLRDNHKGIVDGDTRYVPALLDVQIIPLGLLARQKVKTQTRTNEHIL